MKFAAITMTRGDRTQLLERCIKQVNYQTVKVHKHYIIDYKPLDNNCDLIPRFKKGIELAKADGIDFVFVFEDDDYYPNDYIEKTYKKGFDIIGYSKTIYYHLSLNGIKEMIHKNRSSLFCTAFKINALDSFTYPNDKEPYLDLLIWKFAIENLKFYLYENNIAVGVKHGIGKAGGNGHKTNQIRYTKIDNYFINKIPFYNALRTD
jgi:hypothetical protein